MTDFDSVSTKKPPIHRPFDVRSSSEPGCDSPAEKHFLAAMGDCESVNTFSGIPFHFLAAARTAGILAAGVPVRRLSGSSLRLRRSLWNVRRLLTAFDYGGFQYSAEFLEWAWQPAKSVVKNSVLINCFQLYPPSLIQDTSVEKWFFIDQTLKQLFETGLYGRKPSPSNMSRLCADEKTNYQAARGIIVHSRWAAESVQHDYGIDPRTIHVVVPGANLSAEEYDSWNKSAEGLLAQRISRIASGRPRLVFVGKDWRRKGLLLLIDSLVACRTLGLEPTLRVLGCSRADLPTTYQNIPGIEWVGFIDKSQDQRAFLKSVGDCDIGCLLSQAEAGGIALREYHALGLPTLATDVGGISDHVIAGASVMIPAQSTAGTVAELLASICSFHANIAERAWNTRQSALWLRSIANFIQVWPHSPQYGPLAATRELLLDPGVG